MKNFNRLIPFLMIFSLVLILTGCSKSEADEDIMYGLESDLQTAHKDANMSAKAKYYTADLSALNNSGVSGTAELTLMGNELTVMITAYGLEDGPHPQHIHGFTDSNKNSKCPPASADDDGDGFVEIGEGLPFYGAPQLFLEPFPETDDGTIMFENTYTLSNDQVLTPLQNNTIVLHGMTAELTQIVNDEIEVVSGYIATLPVACGQIQPAQGKNNR